MKLFSIKPRIDHGINNYKLFSIFKKRVNIPPVPNDTFELSDKIFPLKYIKLKTAEKLYSTKFTPSNNDYGKYAYKTFVLDKKTGNPVEIFVRPEALNGFLEHFNLYATVESICYVAGIRMFNHNMSENSITPGDMNSYMRFDYSGLGLREHQIAIERMFMENRDNLKILAIPESYFFHKNCGFEVIKNIKNYDEMKFHAKINEWSELLDIDDKTIRSLAVYNKINHNLYKVDENTTFENFINYAKQNNIIVCSTDFCVPMRLSDNAKDEWKKLIKISPIFLGKKIPDFIE